MRVMNLSELASFSIQPGHESGSWLFAVRPFKRVSRIENTISRQFVTLGFDIIQLLLAIKEMKRSTEASSL